VLNKFRPQCLREYTNFGYSAKGYILPCCWVDSYLDNATEEFKVFYQEKFKLSNVEDVDKEILQSKEWLDFYKMLAETPEKAPKRCHSKCSTEYDKWGNLLK